MKGLSFTYLSNSLKIGHPMEDDMVVQYLRQKTRKVKKTYHDFDLKILSVILVSALGYFVDIYDLLLFSVVRQKSLQDMGIAAEQSLSAGIYLLNCQVAGLLIGGILWGIYADKKGRLSVLFGSIILYSVANFLNAFVMTLDQYAALRFVAGLGLAGELGAGITLVSEAMSPQKRGIGTMLVAALGLLGAVFAGYIGLHYEWRTAFVIGGLMGFALLILRIGVFESGLFEKLKDKHVKRGDFFQLFRSWKIFAKYMRCILVGLPAYFVIGILITGAPEFGKELGLATTPSAAVAVMLSYIGLSLGDVTCSALSQLLQKRRQAIATFQVLFLITATVFLYAPIVTIEGFYLRCFLVGFGLGAWALFVTNASEQFGTNLRGTVTTTVPNFIRGSFILISFSFTHLKPYLGLIHAASVVGGATLIIAAFALYYSDETFGRDLDFIEK